MASTATRAFIRPTALFVGDGAYLAAKAAGREHEMKFVGIDALPQEGVQYVKAGVLDATFAYPTGGAQAIDIALDWLAGKKPKLPDVLQK